MNRNPKNPDYVPHTNMGYASNRGTTIVRLRRLDRAKKREQMLQKQIQKLKENEAARTLLELRMSSSTSRDPKLNIENSGELAIDTCNSKNSTNIKLTCIGLTREKVFTSYQCIINRI